MPITGNKGEWSEIYTLFKLLGEGKVHAGDENMNKLSTYFPIINIIREEVERFDYKPDSNSQVVVIESGGIELVRIPMARFLEESKILLNTINQARGASFECPEASTFMNEIRCERLKAKSSDKTDIQVVIYDFRTGTKPLLGFSIKSYLGGAPTLLNAGNTTNFTYKIVGRELEDSDIVTINNIAKHVPRIKKLEDMGCKLIFHDIDKRTFKNNLLFLDSSMPEFIATCLEISNRSNAPNDVIGVVREIASSNPLNFSGSNIVNFYAHKMKSLLLDTALGMTPAKEWTGRYDANGGYLVVRKDGEIVCYHFYNRNDLEDYLYQNTYFERASRSRYGFGSLYRGEDGNVYMKLNLQIRFKK